MRDVRKGRKLGRIKKQREALLQSLAVHLIIKGKIQTTTAKAKEVRPFVERLISYAKKGGVGAERRVRMFLPSQAARHLVHDIAPQYHDRSGGYTRITKTLRRRGDAAPMAFIELL